MDLPSHPWLTTTNLSCRFPIFETSATALCGSSCYLHDIFNWLVAWKISCCSRNSWEFHNPYNSLRPGGICRQVSVPSPRPFSWRGEWSKGHTSWDLAMEIWWHLGCYGILVTSYERETFLNIGFSEILIGFDGLRSRSIGNLMDLMGLSLLTPTPIVYPSLGMVITRKKCGSIHKPSHDSRWFKLVFNLQLTHEIGSNVSSKMCIPEKNRREPSNSVT